MAACVTCEQLKKELADATEDHLRADAEWRAFLPNEPMGVEDAKHVEELGIADKNALKRHEEAFQRLSEHLCAAHR
jgi:hypothetical protein